MPSLVAALWLKTTRLRPPVPVGSRTAGCGPSSFADEDEDPEKAR
jgi:hypothetical protein